tara:strand:- start:201 stop:560 length:360 start_codon:yes stop_codon:yes gene_type:complete
MSAGDRLRALRKARGWTLEEVAEKIEGLRDQGEKGLSLGMISHIETGRRKGTVDDIKKLARVYSVSPGLLIDEDVDIEKLTEMSLALEGLAALSDDEREVVQKMIDTILSSRSTPGSAL